MCIQLNCYYAQNQTKAIAKVYLATSFPPAHLPHTCGADRLSSSYNVVPFFSKCFCFCPCVPQEKRQNKGRLRQRNTHKKKTNRKAGFIPIKKTKMNDLFFLNFVFALILNDASSISTNGAGIQYIEQMLECYIFILRNCRIIMGMAMLRMGQLFDAILQTLSSCVLILFEIIANLF